MLHNHTEKVDILMPPFFNKDGSAKTVDEARAEGAWLGTFNLWIVQTMPEPALVYQVRSPNSSWEPNKLDVTAGGHYEAGEILYDGLREVEEELGRCYTKDNVTYIGRRLNVSLDVHGRPRNTVVDIALIKDNESLEHYILQKEEVYGITSIPLKILEHIHRDASVTHKCTIITAEGLEEVRTINQHSFPQNWDGYHYKILRCVREFLDGQDNILY